MQISDIFLNSGVIVSTGDVALSRQLPLRPMRVLRTGDMAFPWWYWLTRARQRLRDRGRGVAGSWQGHYRGHRYLWQGFSADHHHHARRGGTCALTTARYYTPKGRFHSQAVGIPAPMLERRSNTYDESGQKNAHKGPKGVEKKAGNLGPNSLFCGTDHRLKGG